MNRCQIKVVGGSCADNIVPFLPGDSIHIGRSRRSGNRIVFEDGDVSGRHCVVRMSDSGEMELEVISDKSTSVDGLKLALGTRVPLQCGQTVRLGASASFLIEPYQDSNLKTTLNPSVLPDSGSSSNVATRLDDRTASAAAPAPEVGKQAAQSGPAKTEMDEKTMYFSPEELEKKKRKYQFRRLLRLVSIGAAVFLFFGLSVVLFILRPAKEQQGIWDNTVRDPNEKKLLILHSDIVGIVFPPTLDYKLSADKKDAEVHSALGMNRDIPLNIVAHVWDDPAGLHVDRTEAFRQCREMLKEKELVFEQISRDPIFVNTGVKGGSGIPLNYASYTRGDFFGYLVFFRYQIQNYYCLIEVPSTAPSLTREYLKIWLSAFFQVMNRIVPSYWEGSSDYRKNTEIKKDLDDARDALRKNSWGEWANAHYYIQSALIKSYEKNDNASLESAKSLLVKLREAQSNWFNAEQLSYDSAKADNNKRKMQDIRIEGQGAFSDEFKYSDYRYDVTRRVWK